MKSNVDVFETQKELLEAMLEIDNAIENANLTVEDLKKHYLDNSNVMNIDTSKKNLIITDGDPFLTIDIIKSLSFSDNENILFINRSYCGVNKWLVKFLARIFDISLEIDTNYNYNDYIGTRMNIVPIGEKSLIDQVRSDFNYDES